MEIGSNCTIQNHAFIALTKPNPKIILGDNVAIGRFSMLTNKNLIRIGNDVLIGANSVVIEDIPPYAIAVGSPAKVVRYRV